MTTQINRKTVKAEKYVQVVEGETIIRELSDSILTIELNSRGLTFAFRNKEGENHLIRNGHVSKYSDTVYVYMPNSHAEKPKEKLLSGYTLIQDQ